MSHETQIEGFHFTMKQCREALKTTKGSNEPEKTLSRLGIEYFQALGTCRDSEKSGTRQVYQAARELMLQ